MPSPRPVPPHKIGLKSVAKSHRKGVSKTVQQTLDHSLLRQTPRRPLHYAPKKLKGNRTKPKGLSACCSRYGQSSSNDDCSSLSPNLFDSDEGSGGEGDDRSQVQGVPINQSNRLASKQNDMNFVRKRLDEAFSHEMGDESEDEDLNYIIGDDAELEALRLESATPINFFNSTGRGLSPPQGNSCSPLLVASDSDMEDVIPPSPNCKPRRGLHTNCIVNSTREDDPHTRETPKKAEDREGGEGIFWGKRFMGWHNHLHTSVDLSKSN